MENHMWFGTRGYMTWVPCPDIDVNNSKVGWSTSMQYINGGAGARRSTGAHKVYEMTWSNLKRDDLRPIEDYADGLYNTDAQNDLIYFHDPMTLNRNVLPQLWAAPGQSASSGNLLIPDSRPDIVPTSANNLRYPAQSAIYTTNADSEKLWVPIPPGFTAWVGAHGSATGAAGVQVTPGSGTPVVLDMLSVTDGTRVNYSLANSGTVDGFELSLTNTGTTDTVTLTGIIVQIIRTGDVPDLIGNFISGQGHSGCEFENHPAQTAHSAYFDSVSMSATFIEVGSWL